MKFWLAIIPDHEEVAAYAETEAEAKALALHNLQVAYDRRQMVWKGDELEWEYYGGRCEERELGHAYSYYGGETTATGPEVRQCES